MLNNIKTSQKNRGFTIVELLIVIVVIAILAAITIVAYNGITSRANATAAQSAANALVKKLEAFNAENGAFPTAGTCITNTTGCTTPTGVTTTVNSSWYSAQGTAFSTQSGTINNATAAPATPAGLKNVWYTDTSATGGCVRYYDYQAGSFKGLTAGSGTCPALTATALTPVQV